MANRKHICPECDSEKFITEPNQYDVLIFGKGDFVIKKTFSTNDKEKIACRECWSEVDVEESNREKRVILK